MKNKHNIPAIVGGLIMIVMIVCIVTKVSTDNVAAENKASEVKAADSAWLARTAPARDAQEKEIADKKALEAQIKHWLEYPEDMPGGANDRALKREKSRQASDWYNKK